MIIDVSVLLWLLLLNLFHIVGIVVVFFFSQFLHFVHFLQYRGSTINGMMAGQKKADYFDNTKTAKTYQSMGLCQEEVPDRKLR